MHTHDHDQVKIDGRRAWPSRAAAVDPAVLYRAAEGRTRVVGPGSLQALQRVVGNSGVRRLTEHERSPALDVVSTGGGQPLEESVRADMEGRLGHNFADVRIHTDEAAHHSAAAVNANAYTVGSNMVFQRDKYDPGSNAGRTLLAHELTHVVQQRSGPVDGTATGTGVRVSDPSDRFECEAAATAERAMSVPFAPLARRAVVGAAVVQREESVQRDEQEGKVTAQGSFTVQRSAADDDLAAYIAKDLATYAAGHASPYAHVLGALAWVAKKYPDIHDEVSASFAELHNAEQLEVYATSPEGPAMLDVLTEAMFTGKVSSVEALQASRILSAKGRSITPDQHAKEAARIADLRHRAEDSDNQRVVNRQAMKLAQSMTGLVAAQRYDAITKNIRDVDDYFADNIAAHLIELLTTPQLEAAARVAAGRTMLDVCYVAIITGSVTTFERLQGDRILAARIRSSDHGVTGDALQNPTVFPIATSWDSTATNVADLQADGTVKVYYDTKTGARQPQFKWSLDTLSRRFGDGRVFSGMVLRPDEVVMVQLFDQDGVIIPVPAIKLIDFFNQQREDFIGKVTTITVLGATAGLGGVGGAGILGWADTVAFSISAGSIFVNTYRKEIAKTGGGKRFLEVWDMAEGIANLYGWGQLGVTGLRLVHAEVAQALRRWQAEPPTGLSAAEGNTIAQAQQRTKKWLDGVKQAEATEIAKAEAGAVKKAGTGEPTRQPADKEIGQLRYPASAPRAPRPMKRPRDEEDFGTVTRGRISAMDRGKGARPSYLENPKPPKTARATSKTKRAALDAEKVNVRFKREFIADPALAKEWKRIEGMKRGPSKTTAVRELEQRAGQLKATNDRKIEGVRKQAEQLRAVADESAAAVSNRQELYRAQPKWVLDDLKRLEDEAVEAMKKAKVKPAERQRRRDPLLRQEIERKHQLAEDIKWGARKPVTREEIEIKRQLAEDIKLAELYRMPHEAEVVVTKAGKHLKGDRFTSGGVKDLDVYEHGFNKANTLSHTEAKALRELGIHPGETMHIYGRYDPCRFCVARMQKAVDTFGGTVVYRWPGEPKGGAHFFRGSDTATKLLEHMKPSKRVSPE